MASPCKRTRFTETFPLDDFNSWLIREGFKLNNKVYITDVDTSAQYGLLAKDNIDSGEIICEIPRSSFVRPEASTISKLLQQEKEKLESGSGWVPLLLTLMHEYYNPTSKWRPYFDLVPDWEELDHPMFWDKDLLLTELKGTGLIELINEDLKRMKSEFETIALPFIEKHPDHFSSENCNFDTYKQMVAFVMAYSFTEPSENLDETDSSDEDDEQVDRIKNAPMMVPFADILNHVSENNAKLEFEKDCFKMISVKSIKKGEEVYNTYGELSNSQLLHMYGFTLQNNIYDLIELPCSLMIKEYRNLHPSDENIEMRIRILKNTGISADETIFAYGLDGFLMEEELHQTLMVLFMDKEQLESFSDSDGWLESEDVSLTNDDLKNLPSEWKVILQRCVKSLLNNLNCDLSNRSQNITSKIITRRQKWVSYLKEGQMFLLKQLMNLLEI